MARSNKSGQTQLGTDLDKKATGGWVPILGAVDSNIKLFALVILAVEGLFTFTLSLKVIRSDHVIWVLALMAVIGVVAMLAGVWLHRIDKFGGSAGGLKASPHTTAGPFLKALVSGAIETVCRAVSLPQTPETAGLRVFIFRAESNGLICTHFWSPNPTQEQVGLRFELRPNLANEVAVVDAALNRRTVGKPVQTLASGSSGGAGEVSPDLKFVLATPIYDGDQGILGVVDFDTSTEAGAALLQTKISEQVTYQLARHLGVIFTLDKEGRSAPAS